jgi:hypothetical protein
MRVAAVLRLATLAPREVSPMGLASAANLDAHARTLT